MHSLVDRIKEVSLRANGLRREKWKYYKRTYTGGKWVDLLEITGSGVADFLQLSCPDSTSSCQFRITYDDNVLEWKCSSIKERTIFSEDKIFGVTEGSSYNKVWIPYLGDSKITFCADENIAYISADSTGDDMDYYNIFPGGFRFNEKFKISVNCDNSYDLSLYALYGIF